MEDDKSSVRCRAHNIAHRPVGTRPQLAANSIKGLLLELDTEGPSPLSARLRIDCLVLTGLKPLMEGVRRLKRSRDIMARNQPIVSKSRKTKRNGDETANQKRHLRGGLDSSKLRGKSCGSGIYEILAFHSVSQ